MCNFLFQHGVKTVLLYSFIPEECYVLTSLQYFYRKLISANNLLYCQIEWTACFRLAFDGAQPFSYFQINFNWPYTRIVVWKPSVQHFGSTWKKKSRSGSCRVLGGHPSGVTGRFTLQMEIHWKKTPLRHIRHASSPLTHHIFSTDAATPLPMSRSAYNKDCVTPWLNTPVRVHQGPSSFGGRVADPKQPGKKWVGELLPFFFFFLCSTP